MLNSVERPLIIAHRGDSSSAPENTLAALRAAVIAGADYAEVDVRLSSDGVAVLMHDEDLSRTATSFQRVNTLTADELSQIDVGSWFSAAHCAEKVPTLVEALEVIGDTMGLIIEVKEASMATALQDALATAKMSHERVLIFSFNFQELQAIHSLLPKLRCVWLVELSRLSMTRTDEVLQRIALMPLYGIGLDVRSLGDEATVGLLARAKVRIFVWTANHRKDMQLALRKGVHGIITDYPVRLANLLRTATSTSL